MTETFETKGPIKLIVRNRAGRIEIHSVDGEHTEVDVLPLRDDESSRTAAADTRAELRTEGAQSVVRVEVPKSRGLISRGADVHVIARVPHGSDLDALGSSADIEARGRFGFLNVKTASGDIDLDNADSEARINSASGDVRVKSVTGAAIVQTASGDVEVGCLEQTGKIQTASGDVHVREARSSLKVQTASGDQAVDAAEAGQVTLQSASGDLRIGVKRGSSLWIDAKSISGTTTSELELSDTPGNDAGPQLEIRAGTMSGDIVVVRADEVTV